MALFSEIGTQNFPKFTRNQNNRSFARKNGRQSFLPWCVTSNYVLIHILKIKTRPVTSSDIVISSLALFGFVLLYKFSVIFLFWHTDMFILHSYCFFFKQSKLQKIRSIYNSWDTIIANKQQYQLLPNPPRSLQFVHSLPLFLLSFTFIHSL